MIKLNGEFPNNIGHFDITVYTLLHYIVSVFIEIQKYTDVLSIKI